MTEAAPVPRLTLTDIPLCEAAVLGGVLIASTERARSILNAYQPGDLTEPRLRLIDQVARTLTARNERTTPPNVVAEAVGAGYVPADRENVVSLLLMELTDITLNPESRVAETYARHVVAAAVRRDIATATARIGQLAEAGSMQDLLTTAADQTRVIRAAMNRIGGDAK